MARNHGNGKVGEITYPRQWHNKSHSASYIVSQFWARKISILTRNEYLTAGFETQSREKLSLDLTLIHRYDVLLNYQVNNRKFLL